MKLLTIDQSTKTGWCVAESPCRDPKAPAFIFGTFRAPRRDDRGERLVILRDGLTEVIEKHRPDVMAWETPFIPFDDGNKAKDGGRARLNVKTTRFLLNIEGVLVEAATRYGLATEDFPAQAWRKTAVGMGVAPAGSPPGFMKKLMIQRAKSLGYGVGKDDNMGDAIGMMLHMLYGEPAARRAQGDLLDRVAGL